MQRPGRVHLRASEFRSAKRSSNLERHVPTGLEDAGLLLYVSYP